MQGYNFSYCWLVKPIAGFSFAKSAQPLGSGCYATLRDFFLSFYVALGFRLSNSRSRREREGTKSLHLRKH